MGRPRARTAPKAKRSSGLHLRLSDVVLTVSAGAALAYLLIAARWVPGAGRAAAGFAIIGVGPLLFRALARRFPRVRAFEVIASFWLLPAAVIGHGSMGPIADSFRAELVDRHLAEADLRLFGVYPYVWLETRLPAWLTELVMLCYYTYYLWPVLIGSYLYFRRDRRLYDQYQLALTLFLASNFLFYALVPAVGPRFFLAHEFQGSLQGVWLTPLLESAMRGPEFLRDCFPSGHTGLTLIVLCFAFWHARRLFWVILPGATGLIAATLVGRFHYAVDLVFAVPLALLAMSFAVAWSKAEPQGVQVVPSPELAFLRRAVTGAAAHRTLGRRREAARV